MKWQGRRKSDNVVDRRRVRAGGIAVGGDRIMRQGDTFGAEEL